MPQQTMKQCWQRNWFLRELFKRFSEDNIPIAAGAVSFFTMLCVVPLLLFVVLIAAYFITESQVSQQLAPLKETALIHDLAKALEIQLLYVVKHRNTLTALVLVLGCWTGSQVFLVLESAINLIWRSRVQRPFWKRRLLSVLLVLAVGTMMVGAVLLTNALRILGSFPRQQIFGYPIPEFPWIVSFLVSVVVPFLLVSAIFAVIYCVLPTKRVTLRTVLPGAFAAAAFWSLSLHLFGWYATNFADYNFLYGSLGGLIFLMLWFYYSAFIMLVGAEVSALYHERLLSAGDADEREVEEQDALTAGDEPPAEVSHPLW